MALLTLIALSSTSLWIVQTDLAFEIPTPKFPTCDAGIFGPASGGLDFGCKAVELVIAEKRLADCEHRIQREQLRYQEARKELHERAGLWGGPAVRPTLSKETFARLKAIGQTMQEVHDCAPGLIQERAELRAIVSTLRNGLSNGTH